MEQIGWVGPPTHYTYRCEPAPRYCTAALIAYRLAKDCDPNISRIFNDSGCFRTFKVRPWCEPSTCSPWGQCVWKGVSNTLVVFLF